MAQELDDGEFWLPSDFLTDEDLLTDFKPLKKSSELFYQGFGIGNGNPLWSNSEMSSPVESVNGSTETESDEDEIITGLSRCLAQSTLQDSSFYSDYGAKGWKLSGSPQSTLCGCKKGGSSSRGSPDSVSRVSSPPLARDAGWDLLCAAAGEVTRMRLIEDTPFYAPPPRPSPVPMPANRPNSAASEGFYRSQVQTQAHLAYLQLQASQRMKEQQILNSGLWSQSGKALPTSRSQGLSMAAWPTLQQSQQQRSQPQHSGSGMRAVFLGGSAAKKERTGTGVFLPRRLGTTTHTSTPRKKPGFSTALLPDRVVHALNLNLESLDTPSHVRTHGNASPEFNYDAAAAIATATAFKNNVPQRAMHQEFRLPQEWTY